MPDIVICGVGGQGTVLASKLLAQAALLDDWHVRTAETIGMAQRGGSVLGHIRLSRPLAEAPLSPLVPANRADVLIGFEPGETVRSLDYLRHGGTVITAQQAIEPVTAALANTIYDGKAELDYLHGLKANGRLGKLVVVDGRHICAELGSTRVLNTVLLGAALASGCVSIPMQAFQEALMLLIKPSFIELNKQALTAGMKQTED